MKRAEVYSTGQDKNTANALFRDAVAMCQANIPGADDIHEFKMNSRRTCNSFG
ncbi:hypothetical protein [Rhizobium herbae]|uniref:DUF982 domain-containing protein n=1 Tax=Rhizobium herbae TaxID=508661 RepID=A0ABS4EVY7_9HYPH|nr:hypothetical protein [Rhizobium herbae]MBP1862104.1 hypothetical protein [Rhizobium herbae]